MSIYETLQQMQVPVAYGSFNEPQELPFIVYIGDGQSNFEADNTYYSKRNRYQIEYYYKYKDENKENQLEQILLEAGYFYEKSEDIYVEADDVYLIYYNV